MATLDFFDNLHRFVRGQPLTDKFASADPTLADAEANRRRRAGIYTPLDYTPSAIAKRGGLPGSTTLDLGKLLAPLAKAGRRPSKTRPMGVGEARGIGASTAASRAEAGVPPAGQQSMSLDDMVQAFSSMMGGGAGGGGGGGGGYSPALMDVNQITDRFARARTELGNRYDRSLEELTSLQDIGMRAADEAAGLRAADLEAYRTADAEVGAALEEGLRSNAEQAQQAMAAHGIAPSADSIGASERAARDAALIASTSASNAASSEAANKADSAYEREIRQFMDESARASALDSRTDTEAALLLAEQQAVQEAEMYNAQAQAQAAAAAASGGGWGGAGGIGGSPEAIAALIGANADAMDAWNYPKREAAMRALAGMPGAASEIFMGLLGEGSTADSARQNLPLVAAELARMQGATPNVASRLRSALGLGGTGRGVNRDALIDQWMKRLNPIIDDYYYSDGTISPAMQGQFNRYSIANAFG